MLPAQQTSDQKPSATPPTPTEGPIFTFKKRADLVLVPVVVKDRKGRHMAGLTKDVFQLEENGKEQAITLFEEAQPPAAGAVPTAAPDRGYSNLPFDNTSEVRLTILVLDLLNTSPFQRADGRDQLVKFLSRGLAPGQTVSVLCLTSKGLKVVHSFTTDANSLIEALKKTSLGAETLMSGQQADRTAGQYREDLVISAVDQIREIAQSYAGIPGRKTMIFAVGYLPELATEEQLNNGSGLAGDLREMWRNLIAANISVYPVHLMEWSRNPARSTLGLDLRATQFADSTGGNRCIESNDLMGCLAEAVDDSSSYYMLGFTIQPDDRKPGWRHLKVKVSAEHASVRARNGFYYGVPPVETPKRPEEITALASPISNSGLPMYVKVLSTLAASSSNSAPPVSGKNTTVQFLVTVPLSSVQVDPSSSYPLDLDVGAIALTSKVKEAAEFLHPVRGNPKPENLQQWAREGLKLQEKLDLPPGSYDVRFLVRDNNGGQIGTVVFPLDVP